ncbi:inositol 2-dehydrogenase [Actinoplanes sp. SE50]|uniref:Gfo/Idh/MocA family oxidoreductase n=1 Tax=unclassified Actinoplanes TaxID=2626549 RepID=UPI00023ECE65|nr:MULTISPECIES: Gfo/Idh/MocA family oxidoreductase [unclassified Actinoplanes]AEV83809.1 myo-inositol 2-dehydrogenase [Actinoplanes sp. SE50/110]ATO82047.1 inositol 2-dehydrogenase [Actinoplanes sp. SE50]SLL99455.1 inositol 2-dehydrogenase [Actinoplanes sp. SE50/110]
MTALAAVRVGVIGTGLIGRDHIRRMATGMSAISVVAVADVDLVLASRVAASVGAEVFTDGLDLIASPRVDAVVICSWGRTHERYVLAAIAAGKPVFCEKPLATSQHACLRIVEAEVAHGSRLVQVGYMRRYDPAYRAVKRVLDSGVIGAPLMMHCAHRNAGVPSFYEPENTITDTAVHEIDMVRWMFGAEVTAVRVLRPRASRNAGVLPDPSLLLLELANEVLVDVEISVNARYGYDIRGEILGEDGTVSLGDPGLIAVRRAGRLASPVPEDWRERFGPAYDIELREWADSLVGGGEAGGPGAWDGYAASVVSDAAVRALRTAERIPVSLVDRPKLYALSG